MPNQVQSVPVGTVLPYAGELTNTKLNSLGWSICNGSDQPIKSFESLYSVIGTLYGGDGISTFNLPDYQGKFLRGVDPKGVVDKDAFIRTAQNEGGASGSSVGTNQGCATALPTGGKDFAFTASVAHVPSSGSHDAYSGSNALMLTSNVSQKFLSNGGGDLESRPINAYVNYIIKMASSAVIPVGAIIQFAGPLSKSDPLLNDNYLLCQGTSLTQTDYSALFDAIGVAHGGGDGKFDLPDYRGRFLRGVDNGAKADPDTATRTIMAKGGNKGDAVGSVQAFATAKPVTPFEITLTCGTDHKDSDHCAGHDNSAYNSGSVTQSLNSTGGNKETRPVNVYIDNYILKETDAGTSDIFPIGSIIGFPGSVEPDSNHWLPCNGSVVPNQIQYQALYGAIIHNWGGDSTNFNIPNFNGIFLRGTDYSTGRDPDALSRVAEYTGGATKDAVGTAQDFATAKPVGSAISTSIPHLPTEEYDTAAAIWCSEVDAWNGGSTSLTVTGGDSETRPINVSVNYYIKIATIS